MFTNELSEGEEKVDLLRGEGKVGNFAEEKM